jgi:hypothetical protein
VATALKNKPGMRRRGELDLLATSGNRGMA